MWRNTTRRMLSMKRVRFVIVARKRILIGARVRQKKQKLIFKKNQRRPASDLQAFRVFSQHPKWGCHCLVPSRPARKMQSARERSHRSPRERSALATSFPRLSPHWLPVLARAPLSSIIEKPVEEAGVVTGRTPISSFLLDNKFIPITDGERALVVALYDLYHRFQHSKFHLFGPFRRLACCTRV